MIYATNFLSSYFDDGVSFTTTNCPSLSTKVVENDSFNVYPNPVKNKIYLKNIDVELSKGMYFIQIKTSKKIEYKKIIKL